MLDHRLIDRLSRNQDKMANLWCLEKGVWVVVNLQFLKTVLRVCKKFRQPTLFSTAMQSPSSNTMVWCGSTFCCSASGPERAMENRINSTDGPLGWKQDYYLKRNGKQYNFNLRNFCQILTRGKHCNQEPKKMCISSPSDMVKSASFIWILKVKRNAETPNASSCGGCIFQTQLCLICLTDYTLCRFSGISVQTHLNLSYSERFNLILVSKHLSTIKKELSVRSYEATIPFNQIIMQLPVETNINYVRNVTKALSKWVKSVK